MLSRKTEFFPDELMNFVVGKLPRKLRVIDAKSIFAAWHRVSRRRGNYESQETSRDGKTTDIY